MMRSAKSTLMIFTYIFAMFLLPFISMATIQLGFNTNNNEFITVMANLVSYVFLLIVVVVLFKEDLVTDFKRIQSTKKYLAGIFIGWGILYIGLIFSNILLLYVFKANDNSVNQQVIEDIMKIYPVLMAFTTVGLAPICEEVVFRLTIMKQFKKYRWVGLLVSSLLFGLIHVISAGDFLYSIPYIIMGLALGYSYYKHDNIWYPIGVHLLQNLFSTVILLLTMFML